MNYINPSKLRAYFFGNMYISQIAHGIQAAHVVTKLFASYGRLDPSVEADMLYDWADVGVTKILLNGGYQSNLADVYKVFEFIGPILGLPYAKFHEEEAALNGALTSVGIVVPAEVYDMDMISWTSHFEFVKTPQEVLATLDRLRSYEKANDKTGYQNLVSALLNITLKSARLA